MCKQCHKMFNPLGSEHHCQSCMDFNNARCLHPQKERKQSLDDFVHFNFKSTWSNSFIEGYDGTSIYGYHSRDLKDQSKHCIHINLYKFKDMIESDIIQNICINLQHEFFFHYVNFEIGELEACKQGDCALMKKLEVWLLG